MRKNGWSAIAVMAALLVGISTPATRAAGRAPAGEASKADAAVAKALDFLKSHQNPDGSWQSPKEPPGITAIVLKAFAQDPAHKLSEPFLAKGLERMRGYQNPDGSVAEILVTYNTAITISAMAATKDPALKESIAKAVAYLKGTQWTDKIEGINEKDPSFGGWSYGTKGRADLSNVQTALDALHDAGLKSDDPAFQAALKFITRSQNNSETNDQPWAGDDGSFIYTPANGGASAAGQGVSADGKRRILGYGSMTYAGLKSMLYAGLTKDDKRVQAAWKWVRNKWTLDGNPGLQGSDPRSGDGLFYYYHTLARALRAYGEPIIVDSKGAKHDWRVELIDKLSSTQNADGSWTGTQKWMEGRPVLSTTFGVLAMQEAMEDLKEHPAK